MDGISGDADVLFVLSTNRPQILEPALAARPGRIDQAIEFPLPDAESRRRLFDLYGQGLSVDPRDIDDLVARTAGTSPAFIRELLRKAALVAADKSPGSVSIPALTRKNLDQALREMVVDGGALTKTLLGVAPGAFDDE
jgi:ATP-dependent 26S proteasome regulatory subunit